MTETQVKFYNMKIQRAQDRLNKLLMKTGKLAARIAKNRKAIASYTARLDKVYASDKSELHIRSKPILSEAVVGANFDASEPADSPCQPTQ
jgi:hypothetical protein